MLVETPGKCSCVKTALGIAFAFALRSMHVSWVISHFTLVLHSCVYIGLGNVYCLPLCGGTRLAPWVLLLAVYRGLCVCPVRSERSAVRFPPEARSVWGGRSPLLTHWDFPRNQEGRKEMFYLTTHSTHFIYGYMASDIW